MNSVYPSGLLLATYAAAMEPLAPGLFSITTGLPSDSASFWPSNRAPTSVPLPGPNATTMVMGRLGYGSCAAAGEVSASAPQAIVIHVYFMRFSSYGFPKDGLRFALKAAPA